MSVCVCFMYLDIHAVKLQIKNSDPHDACMHLYIHSRLCIYFTTRTHTRIYIYLSVCYRGGAVSLTAGIAAPLGSLIAPYARTLVSTIKILYITWVRN